LHHFVAAVVWDAVHAVLVIDDTGLSKKGSHRVLCAGSSHSRERAETSEFDPVTDFSDR
jgi:hypothetical protein